MAVSTIDALSNGTSEKLTTSATGITVTGNATFADNGKAIFGAGSDLQIYHSGSESIIQDNGTGDLRIQAANLQLNSWDNAESYIVCQDNGAVSLFYDNAVKLATTSGGITVNSILDLESSGSDSIIRNDGGPIFMQSNSSIKFTDVGNNETFAVFNDNGAVDLYYDNSNKLQTTSSGVNISGTAVTDGVTVDGTLDIEEVYEKVQTSVGTSGTIGFETDQFGVLYYTNNQAANRTINFQNVNANLGVGQSVTCTVLLTQGSTAYYLNAYQVDGSSVTPKWSGGSAPTEGNASGIDVYTFTIIKTANATFTVLASQTQYA